ncbi:MAG: hypothetical protein Q9178_006732 [Gyalolechia marmorata]
MRRSDFASITLTRTYTRESQATLSGSFPNLSKEIKSQGSDLQSKIVAFQANVDSSTEHILDTVVRSARSVVPLASPNKHFSTPQTVSSIFTGRQSELDTLRNCILESKPVQEGGIQRRFVIYGLPGSGKTQFCCKFALDNRQSFWGVFWIDASSKKHAKQSFSTIARIGKVDSNERAAKNWLSTLGKERPWLLIVDNADELDFPAEELFPDSVNGVILITTRNPVVKMHGTAGPRCFHFVELGEKESIELLLRAADEPSPWCKSSLESAKQICQTLGYLPLALIHAGKTILARLCTLANYLDFFSKNWNRIREARSSLEASSLFDANAAIYSSYELIHDGLVAKGTRASEDALDLLKIFSFFHRQRIRVDIILQAAGNPKLEKLERERQAQDERLINNRSRQRLTLAKTLQKYCFDILAFLVELGYRPVLPRILMDMDDSIAFDELRLRAALKELLQFSLIFANPDPRDDSYSMHPAVHLWVRERPGMTIGDQAVWCQASATVLSHAILLPPLGDKEHDEDFRRDLLPHVSHVQSNEALIRATILKHQALKRRAWPVLQPRLNRAQALQLVKFSLVYTQCGLLAEAEKMQLQILDFSMKTLGIEHTFTIDVMLLLSRTYRCTNNDEAADLQQRVFDVCLKVRGKNDLKTLKVMDMLGSSRWQQGRVLEARNLQEAAVDGLKKVLGSAHPDMLRAMGNLGRSIGKDFGFTKAIKIHSEVLPGLRTQLGQSHLDTLTARENLAMAYYDRAAHGYGHPGDLDTAVTLQQEVWEERRELLGKENLFTLFAGVNLARIKAFRGELDEALAIFLPGYEIAIRNLGETHFGVLYGKMHFGRILTYAKRYNEAETLLMEVVDSHGRPRQGHSQRLLAIMFLIQCRNLQGRQAETADLLEELMESTKAHFGESHPWVTYLSDPAKMSIEPDEEATTPIAAVTRIDSGTGSLETITPLAVIAKYGHIKA